MEIIKLDQTDSPDNFIQIARLHIAEIHHGFLSLMGVKFLSKLYQELSLAPFTGIWIAVDGAKILGFIAGSGYVARSYYSVMKRAGFSLAFQALHSISNPEVMKKLPTILYYPFRNRRHSTNGDEQGEKAELLAIAVESHMQGRGIGRLLVQNLEIAFIEWGRKDKYYVATNSDDPNSNEFYRKLGFVPYCEEKHNDLILQVYQKAIEIKIFQKDPYE